MKMNKDIRIVLAAWVCCMFGLALAFAGAEKLGKLLVYLSILTGMVFIVRGNIKFWLSDKKRD